MAQRITLSILILLSILFLPFYTSLFLAIAGIIYFPFFWEAIALFFISDLLYGTERELYFGIISATTFLGMALLIIGESLKKKLKFYPSN